MSLFRQDDLQRELELAISIIQKAWPHGIPTPIWNRLSKAERDLIRDALDPDKRT